MPDDLARVVLEIVGDTRRDITLESDGEVNLLLYKSLVLPGLLIIVLKKDNSDRRLPPHCPFFIDLTGLRRDYYPYVEDDSRELTHTWISSESEIIIAHGTPAAQPAPSYGHRLPESGALRFTPRQTLAGVLVTPGYDASLQLIRSLGSGFDHQSFARDGNAWRMGRFAPLHETVSLTAIYR